MMGGAKTYFWSRSEVRSEIVSGERFYTVVNIQKRNVRPIYNCDGNFLKCLYKNQNVQSV
jgi:hypothetical protein